MGQIPTSFAKCEEAIFLKSTNAVIDVNAQGAFSMFVIAKSSELHEDSKAVRPSSLRLYNHCTCEWVNCTEEMWTKLAKWAREHATVPSGESDGTEDTNNNKHCEPYVFDAHKAYECRDKLKHDSGGRQSIILISLVVTTVNIEGWIESQKDNAANTKSVKVTQKEIITSDETRWISYTRMFCRAAEQGLTSIVCRSGPKIALHNALYQIDTTDDMHYAVTACNAIIVDGKTGTIQEGSFKKGTGTRDRDELFCLIKNGERGADVLDDIRKILDRVCDKTSKHKSTMASGDQKDRFVALVGDAKCGAAKVSVQLLSSLNEDIQTKIRECKSAQPSKVSQGSRVCDLRGTMFKYAKSVWLACADFNAGFTDETVSVIRYE